MKWLFSISYYFPYVSGLTIYVKRLAEELVKKDNEVTVLCMKHDKDLRAEEIINGVKVFRAQVVANISKGFISLDWVYQSWKKLQKIDVVVINLPQAEGWIPAVIAKLMKKKIIAIYHCEINLPGKIIQWGLEQVNWLSLELADKIVTYTQDYADYSKFLSKYPEKLSCIYPPIPDLTVDETLKSELKKKIGPGPVIGVAARLAREKGLEYLFEALPMIKTKVKIAIAGPMEPAGEKEYKEKILKLAEKYKDRIIFLGTIDPDKMGAFYSVIDILVLPSINSTEAFGMVQVEAMMKGVPVVATDLPGVRIPILKTGMGKIVPSKNCTALASAIEDILKNKNQYVINGNLIKKEFEIATTLDDWTKLTYGT